MLLRNRHSLPWHWLIMMQLLIGSLLITFCAYTFRIPVEQVSIVSSDQLALDAMSGMPMKVEVSYPGLGSVSIEDPKELLQLKTIFQELFAAGSKEPVTKRSKFAISGVMHYLDQDPSYFIIDAKSFSFNDEYVSSLNISAQIRQLQSQFIDKLLTEDMIVAALNEPTNSVASLVDGKLTPLSQSERVRLMNDISMAGRVIDFSPITQLDHQPVAHYVLQLNDSSDVNKHWLHIDAYDSGYFVVYDLLDETNHHAYFKLETLSQSETQL